MMIGCYDKGHEVHILYFNETCHMILLGEILERILGFPRVKRKCRDLHLPFIVLRRKGFYF